MRRSHRVIGLLLGMAALAAADEPSGTFIVPGAFEPRAGKLVWRKPFRAAAQPGWTWVPAGWVRLSRGWGFQPGFWRRSDQLPRVPGYRPPSIGSPQRRVTIVMPGPGMPGVGESGPTGLQGDPDVFSDRIVGPVLAPEVVRSAERLDALVEGPIDWRSVTAWRSRLAGSVTGMMGLSSGMVAPVAGVNPTMGVSTGFSPAAAPGSLPLMSPSYYIGTNLPGTSYPSMVPGGTGIPGQATYIGTNLPGTAYPSLVPAPAGIPGQSYYIGNDLPGTSYPSLLPSAGQSINGYGYGTAPPGNTAGQAGGVVGP